MPPAATTSDAFNAVHKPRRREILYYLELQERPVGEIEATLASSSPRSRSISAIAAGCSIETTSKRLTAP